MSGFRRGFPIVGVFSPQPAVPASGTSYRNTNPFICVVYVDAASGAGVAVSVGGHSVVSAPAAGDCTIILPPNETITLTYSSAPTWVWYGFF